MSMLCVIAQCIRYCVSHLLNAHRYCIQAHLWHGALITVMARSRCANCSRYDWLGVSRHVSAIVIRLRTPLCSHVYACHVTAH